MRKRGQVTLFVIIGLMIVVIVALFLILKGNIKGQTEVPEEFSNVNDFVQGCVEYTGSKTLFMVGFSGGYFLPKEKIEDFTYFKENYITLGEFEESLGTYFDANLRDCISLLEEEYKISDNEIKSEFSIEDNSVKLKVDYPFTVTRGENSFEFNEGYEAEFDVRLNSMYDLGKEIFEESRKELFCISCIIESSLEKDLRLDISEIEGKSLFTIYDDNFKTEDGVAMRYIFAA